MKPARLSPAEGELTADSPNLATVMRRIGSYVESLHERFRFLEAVVDNFPGGISVYDSELRMVLCNEQQKRLLDNPQSCSPMACRQWKTCSASTRCVASTVRATSRIM